MARGNRRIAAIAVAALTAVAGSASAAQAASFTIKKESTPAGDPTSFAFSWEGVKQSDGTPIGSPDGSNDPFSLAGGESKTVEVAGPGFYTVTESAVAGWKIASIVCDDSTDVEEDKAVITLEEGKAVIELSEGEDKTCTFYNEKLPQPIAPTPVVETPQAEIVPTVVQPPAPTPPVIQVAPTRVRSAAARLLAPTRCVSNRYSVAVTGGPVRSVSFWVNGKRVKTVRARTGQRRFSANLPLRSAVARVQARVTFASDARPRSRTLRTTIRRCAPRVVRPQFTG